MRFTLCKQVFSVGLNVCVAFPGQTHTIIIRIHISCERTRVNLLKHAFSAVSKANSFQSQHSVLLQYEHGLVSAWSSRVS